MRRRPSPVCPRCGYDQSGEVGQWNDRCPIRGRCVECGHDYDWADIFDPTRRDIDWSIEHAGSFVELFRRVPWTILRAAWPPRFWRPVGVRARSVPHRLAIAAIVALAIVWSLGVVPVTVLAGMERLGTWTPVDLGEYVRGFADDGFGFDGVLGDLVNGLILPMAHFNSRSLAAGVPVIRAFDFSFVKSTGVLRETPFWLAPVGASLTWGFVLTCLPVTRRLAKLRLAHVGRAVLGSFIGIAVALGAARVAVAGEALGVFGPQWNFGLAAATLVWVLVWWLSALWRGWSIGAPGLLFTGTIAAILGGIALMAHFGMLLL